PKMDTMENNTSTTTTTEAEMIKQPIDTTTSSEVGKMTEKDARARTEQLSTDSIGSKTITKSNKILPKTGSTETGLLMVTGLVGLIAIISFLKREKL
ncbi:MAG: LPXTG cell wall anchor domain-containing protein, partial [Streptococcus minor]|nr:LPXTG cell wall anchor domain-containing protein [Streptococcus minor]